MPHVDKLTQTISLKEFRTEDKLPRFIDGLPRYSKTLVKDLEKRDADIATRINWLIDRAAGYYASIHQHNQAVDIALAAESTYYQVTGFTTDGPNHQVTPDYTENHITINKSGDYLIFLGVACHSHASNLYEVDVQINNGDTEYDEIDLHFNTAVAGRVINGFAMDYISLTKDDTVEAWVKRLDGGGATKTITIDHITLGVKRVGEA